MSNEILNNLLKEYEQKRRRAELVAERHKQELYNKIPRLAKIEEEFDKIALGDEKWKKVTVEDAILHKVGFNKGLLDIDVDDASKYETYDYLDIVFKTKLEYNPGEVYQYTDASYYLLSRVVNEISGVDLLDFLRPILMKKMNFKELAWSKCPNGYSIGATGLYLRTEDMIKLGILFLNKGKWKEERIVSNEWINKVILNEYEFKKLKDNWYVKEGMRGQILMFNFELNKVIACHSFDDDISYDIFI